MPNTPALVGKGVSVITENGNLNNSEKQNVHILFSSIGKVLELPENLFDAVTGLSGSGPAYVYTFIQALIQAGVLHGLDTQTAKTLAVATVLGSAEMVKQSNEHIGSLIDKVTSPGGTTIQALASMEKDGLKNAIINGVTEAVKRSKELGRE